MAHENSARKGFTIVEAVIVAAIIAIIAIVSIPTYTNYVLNSRRESVDNLAQSAAAAADIFYRKTGSDPSVDDLNLHYNEEKFNVSISGATINVTMIGKGMSTNVTFR